MIQLHIGEVSTLNSGKTVALVGATRDIFVVCFGLRLALHILAREINLEDESL